MATLRDRLGWSWHDFPAAHLDELREVASYSLRGWMFSLSTLGRERIAGTARNLVEETIVFAAVLLVFFANYGSAVLSLLLESQVGDSIFIAHTQSILLTAVLPALAILPFFVFRFAMVSTGGFNSEVQLLQVNLSGELR